MIPERRACVCEPEEGSIEWLVTASLYVLGRFRLAA